MAVGGGKAAATGGSNADVGLAAMQATVNQAATDLQQLVLQLEGVRSATDIEDLDTRGREAAVYLDRVVAQHEKAATNASSDARAAAVRNRGRLESLERRLRSARRTAAQVSAAADRAALLNGGESRRKGKNQAVVSETLRAAKSQLSSNIDSGLEALVRRPKCICPTSPSTSTHTHTPTNHAVTLSCRPLTTLLRHPLGRNNSSPTTRR